jgi:RecA-family ATPase
MEQDKDTKVIPMGQITAAELAADVADNIRKMEASGPFIGKPANKWLEAAAQKPMPKKLFGDLWVEGELCVLFAPTNAGKSVLAVQIADCITKGMSWAELHVQSAVQKVLYFDFELSDRQFAKRYSQEQDGRYCDLYQFSEKFIRYESQPVEDAPEDVSLADYYIQRIRAEVDQQAAKVVIIDNLTWISTRLEKSADAGPFMQKLNRLKREKELSILLIAHTPKRDATREISIYDLQGSAMIGNFLDSCFCVNKSRKDPQARYIKQVKVRDGEQVYGEDYVIACTLEKAGNFLGYQFMSYTREREHLHVTETDASKLEADIIEAYDNGAKSYREVAATFGVSHMKVKRITDRHAHKSKEDH